MHANLLALKIKDMVSPSNPGQKDSKEVFHDGMSNADHEAQFRHANCGTESMKSDENKVNEEKEERSEKKEEEEED